MGHHRELIVSSSACQPNHADAKAQDKKRAQPHTHELLGRVLPEMFLTIVGDFPQRIAKGVGGKGPRQKTSKNRQKVSKSFSTLLAQGKKRQKSSKSVKKFFDTFRQFSRGTIFPAPFGGL